MSTNLPDPSHLSLPPPAALLPGWLRLCAANRELVANYDRLRGTNLSGRGTAIDRLIDEATGRLETEAQAFFDWCVEVFERMDWEAGDE